jgi:hypothetical protein
MAITFNSYVVALYALGSFGGFFVVGAAMKFMRWHAGLKRPSFKPIDFWLGSIERLVTMLIFAFKPDQLPWFIGAWVGLKFAANWKRQTGPETSEFSMLFLIGNVLSFGFALGLAKWAQWLSGP